MVGKDDLEVQLSLKLSRAFLPQDALSLLPGHRSRARDSIPKCLA